MRFLRFSYTFPAVHDRLLFLRLVTSDTCITLFFVLFSCAAHKFPGSSHTIPWHFKSVQCNTTVFPFTPLSHNSSSSTLPQSSLCTSTSIIVITYPHLIIETNEGVFLISRYRQVLVSSPGGWGTEAFQASTRGKISDDNQTWTCKHTHVQLQSGKYTHCLTLSEKYFSP